MIFSLFNLTERAALAIDAEDIYFSFVYQIGILMEDHPTEENQSIRHAEVTIDLILLSINLSYLLFRLLGWDNTFQTMLKKYNNLELTLYKLKDIWISMEVHTFLTIDLSRT